MQRLTGLGFEKQTSILAIEPVSSSLRFAEENRTQIAFGPLVEFVVEPWYLVKPHYEADSRLGARFRPDWSLLVAKRRSPELSVCQRVNYTYLDCNLCVNPKSFRTRYYCRQKNGDLTELVSGSLNLFVLVFVSRNETISGNRQESGRDWKELTQKFSASSADSPSDEEVEPQRVYASETRTSIVDEAYQRGAIKVSSQKIREKPGGTLLIKRLKVKSAPRRCAKMNTPFDENLADDLFAEMRQSAIHIGSCRHRERISYDFGRKLDLPR